MSLLLKECRWCSVSFVPKHFNDAYCSDKCREEKERETEREKRCRFIAEEQGLCRAAFQPYPMWYRLQ